MTLFLTDLGPSANPISDLRDLWFKGIIHQKSEYLLIFIIEVGRYAPIRSTGTSDMLPALSVKSSGSGWLGYMIPYMIRTDIETM